MAEKLAQLAFSTVRSGLDFRVRPLLRRTVAAEDGLLAFRSARGELLTVCEPQLAVHVTLEDGFAAEHEQPRAHSWLPVRLLRMEVSRRVGGVD